MAGNIVFDFDGVIHSYKSKWTADDVIPDPPVEGIKEAIEEIRDAGYRVIILSTRCSCASGRAAIEEWLKKYEIVVDDIVKEKPVAKVYIDDRGLRFDGRPETLLEQINHFSPWWM